MVEAKFSASYDAKRMRVARLPKLVERAVRSGTKKSAIAVIEAFQDGIRTNSFKLVPLKPATVDKKRAQGMSRPKAPLYGRGDEVEKKSYINMLRIRKLKNGWKVFASWAKHHSADIQLRSLLQIHEEGAIIKQRRGNNVVLIRIPPRPALAKALRRVLKGKIQQENTLEVRRAMRLLLKTGSTKGFRKIYQKTERDRRFDEA